LDGPPAAMRGSTIAGPRMMPTAANMRQNWSLSRRTSSSPRQARAWRHCSKRAALCRSLFAAVTDPVGQGFVASLARPGGNTTGFALYEYGFSAKWLELLKEIAPSVTRVAVVRDPSLSFTSGELGTIQGAASSLRVEVSPLGARDAGEIESGIAAF